ncbi:GntR family transcriptional regulator [soil metagenome]
MASKKDNFVPNSSLVARKAGSEEEVGEADILPSLNGGSPRNLTEECVLRIMTLLKEGKLKAGDRIGEISIAAEIGMGRAPTRSALDRLGQAGVLERIPRSGTFVRELSLKEFSEIMDVRAYLECLSARLAAQIADSARAEKLVAMAKEADYVNDDSLEVPLARRYHIDSSFHLHVAEASGNGQLYSLLENQHLLEFSMVSGLRILPKHMEMKAQTPTHESIARAIQEHRVEDAGILMRDHIIKTKQIRVNLSMGEV